MNTTRTVLLSLLLALTTAAVSAQAPAAAAPGGSNARSGTAASTIQPVDTSAPAPAAGDSPGTDSSKASRPDSVEYDADLMEYDIKRKIVLLTGHGVIRYEKMSLYADTIHYVIEKGVLLASGSPMLIDRGDTVAGETMVYHLRTRRGKVKYAGARTGGAHYDGDQIAKSDSTLYYIHEGDYTTCAVTDHPHYFFYSRNIKVLPGDKAVTKPLILNVGDAPVGALPYFILPLDKDRKSGFLRWRWGGHPGQGGYLDNVGYYWVPNDYMDFTFAGRIQEFEEYVFNLAGQYRLKYWLSGNISGRYTLASNYDTLSNRWAINYNHYQNVLPDETMKLTGSGSVASGKTFYRTFSEDTSEILNQETSANLSLTKTFPRINASTSVTWNRKHNFMSDMVDQDAPYISFTLPTRALIPPKRTTGFGSTAPGAEEEESKWYNDIRYSYRVDGRRKLTTSSEDADVYYRNDHTGLAQSVGLSYSQKVFRWFHLSPSFSAGLSLFDSYIVPDGQRRYDTLPVYSSSDTLRPGRLPVTTRPAGDSSHFVYYEGLRDTTWLDDDTIAGWNSVPPHWNAGVSLSTTLYGLFPFRIFSFAGIRHTLTPSVSYSFRPERTIGREYPSVVSYVGDQQRSQSIGFSVGNLFQGKTVKPDPTGKGKPVESKFTIVSADLGTAYDFEAEKRKWSDIRLSARTTYKIMNVSYGSSYRPYDAHDNVARPRLMNYTVSLSPRNLSASGSLWGGDRLVLESLHARDSVAYAGAGDQNWNVSLNPSYTFNRSRAEVDDEFTTRRVYNLNMSAHMKFTRRWTASWNGYYNFVTGKLEGHTVNFTCDLECWDLRFDWRPSGYNPGFYFTVGIKQQRDIKWEYRD